MCDQVASRWVTQGRHQRRGARAAAVIRMYHGGNTVLDYTDPTRPREIAFADPTGDVIGDADSWSTYWYNDYIYANGGLDRRGATRNRGVDVFQLIDEDGNVVRARKFHHMNPQTQEVEQTVGDDGSNNNPTRQPGDAIQ